MTFTQNEFLPFNVNRNNNAPMGKGVTSSNFVFVGCIALIGVLGRTAFAKAKLIVEGDRKSSTCRKCIRLIAKRPERGGRLLIGRGNNNILPSIGSCGLSIPIAQPGKEKWQTTINWLAELMDVSAQTITDKL
jgi:hypothetical protein